MVVRRGFLIKAGERVIRIYQARTLTFPGFELRSG